MNKSSSGEANSVALLLSALRQHDWLVNWKTADALAAIGEHAFPHLLQALEDSDGYARNGAAIALGKIGNKDATLPLIKALQWHDDRVYEDDEDQEAQISAATALGKLGNDAACQALISELEKLPSLSFTLASYIVEALGGIGDPRAVPAIVRAFNFQDFELHKIASWALTKLGAKGVDALLGMVSNRDQCGRSYIIRALGTNSVASATPILLQILSEPGEDKSVRCHAAEALGRIGGSPKILPILLDMLQAPDEQLRSGALSGLGALHDLRAYEAIVEHLDHPTHRYVAIMALGELGDSRACDLLVPIVEGKDASSAVHAATAVGKLGCHGALPSLIQLRDRIAASDSHVLKAHMTAVEAAILKLQQLEPKPRSD